MTTSYAAVEVGIFEDDSGIKAELEVKLPRVLIGPTKQFCDLGYITALWQCLLEDRELAESD